MSEEENFSPVDDMTTLLPYLSEGFCDNCTSLLESRLQNLNVIGRFKGISLSNGQNYENSADICSTHTSSQNSESNSECSTHTSSQNSESNSECSTHTSSQNSENSVDVCSSNLCTPEKSIPSSSSSPSSSVSHKNEISSWGSLKLNGHVVAKPSPESVLSNRPQPVNNTPAELGDESDEYTRFLQVGRTKDFSYMERVGGKQVNVLKGLELHTKVFSPIEQMNIVELVHSLKRKGQAGKLRERTFSEPIKWKRGKGRVTLQFGCCYNYAVDKKGNPPGIMREEEVDPLPPMFKAMIKRLVRWHVLPPTCVPNSCIVNIYDEGDCIPPHIDHHDFLRPFCTVSFLAECDILFGAHLSVVGDGEFSGPVSIPLPVGSVLILSGNGADVAKHCVPGVPAKRISITFRKMDDSKLPYKFSPDPELRRLQPLRRTLPSTKSSSPVLQASAPHQGNETERGDAKEMNSNTIYINLDLGQYNFPPLGSSKVNKRGSR